MQLVEGWRADGAATAEAAGIAEALDAYQDLLARDGRMQAQRQLFGALRRAPAWACSALTLVNALHASQGLGPEAKRNGRKAVHERAKALRRSLHVLGTEFGGTIGAVCRLSWSNEEGDTREYRLEVPPWDGHPNGRAQQPMAELRSAALRLLEGLGEGAGAFTLGQALAALRLAERLREAATKYAQRAAAMQGRAPTGPANRLPAASAPPT